MYILFGGDFTRASLVQWVLEEGNLEFELRKVDILKGEHRSSDFLAINPAGLVPVLITPEGEALTETAALMLYLADRHQLEDLAPPPSDPDRGRFLSAVFYTTGEIQAEMKRFHFPHRFSLRREDDGKVQEHAKANLMNRLGVANARLEVAGPYLLGPRFSLADFYLCFWIAYLDRDAACRRYSAIDRLYELVCARPVAARILKETELAAEAYAQMNRAKPGGVIA